MSKSDVRNKIQGAIFGFAIGDAMGATTEFMDEKSIKAKFGTLSDIVGGGWLRLPAGQVTDDTQMMLCVIDALKDGGRSQDMFRRCVINNFINWYKSNPPDVGNQCSKAIHRLMVGAEIDYDRHALGNGSLMRALPCALVGNAQYNVIQGDLTHRNPITRTSIMAYHTLVQQALVYGQFDMEYAKDNVYMRGELLEPTGRVSNTLSNAIYWVITSKSFEDVIVSAVNHGGDADTIAALAGGLAGTLYGGDNIPEKWINQLKSCVKGQLEEAVDFLTSCCQKPGFDV